MAGFGSSLGALIGVGEATFARRLRVVTTPVIALFRLHTCEASRALLPTISRLAEEYQGQLTVLNIDIERSPNLAEQFGIRATPTLVVLHECEEVTRMVGFAPEPLLRLLFEQVANNALEPGRIWSPIEQVYEDAVLLPLLAAWGWQYQRQVVCRVKKGEQTSLGRIDVLAYATEPNRPQTLFEAKRHLANREALQQAANQALGYALALDLTAFFVAAPMGLWLYRRDAERALLVQRFSSLEVTQQPALIRHSLAVADPERCALS
jgi:thioredoxin-like negative regulator of GroEL